MSVQAYLTPTTLDECLGCLTQYQGEARLIGGGTDLMLQIEAGRSDPRVLVDATRIKGFDRIEITDDSIHIGAGATHAAISGHEKLVEMVPALTAACGSVGSLQIRNVATLAGNVVNAQPAADGAMALVALNAQAEIASAKGVTRTPVEDLYLGLGKSRIDPSQEVLTGFILDKPGPGDSCAFGRIAPRNALCLPTANAAVRLSAENGRIIAARISLGPVSDRPFRPLEAEKYLAGVALDDQAALLEAARLAARASNPRSSCLRGCSDYRKQLIKILCGRVLREAAGRI